MARDKAFHVAREAQDGVDVVVHDTRNRLRGVVAEARRAVRRQTVADDVLAERVRAELGRVSRHPRSIDVRIEHGTARLSGPILADEVDRVLRAVRHVPGVRQVDDGLDAHQQAGDIPGLQGSGQQPARPEPGPELLQEHWSPAARLTTAAAGGGAAAYGMTSRGWRGLAVAAVGLALVARAVTNLRLARLTGAGAKRNAVNLEKSISVVAPVDEVFALWDGFERFPSFMTNVRRVSRGADGRSHWEVTGPAGTTVEWDAEVTKRVPNQELAWKTCPGAPVQHAGIVQFEGRDGVTEVTVRLSYNPVVGAVGHAAAVLLGADPHKQLDEDLLRMKTFAETGTPAHDAAARP